MPDDTMESQQQRLRIYRETLAHLLNQAALHGGEAFAPTPTASGIRETRQEIRRLKEILQAAGVAVADHPDDEPSQPGPLHQTLRRNEAAAPAAAIAQPSDAASSCPYHSCFVSYSTQDEVFAQQFVAWLRAAGLNVWFASDDVQAGTKLYDQIRGTIRRQDKLVVVLSEHSLQSEWVTSEIRLARREEIATGQRKLFPIRLVDMPTLHRWETFDVDTGKDLAVEVREYFIPDFSNWRDKDAFETAIVRLLRDLRVKAV